MTFFQVAALSVLCAFYGVYVIKSLMLRHQGITANLLGKGEKPKKAQVHELRLRSVTMLGTVVQFGSVLLGRVCPPETPLTVRAAGVAMMLAGFAFFFASVFSMRGNWRAGFDRRQKTSLVTTGIYRISRNPAFVGFDLLYAGCAAAFPNVLNAAVAVAAAASLHIQILGEETFLAEVFGQDYSDYRSAVRRYL